MTEKCGFAEAIERTKLIVARPEGNEGSLENKMDIIDVRGALPRTIMHGDLGQFAGDEGYWFCDHCKQWRTATVSPGGTLVCPTCDEPPDWDAHNVMLSYRSRRKIVDSLCAPGAEWRAHHDAVIEQYSNFIDQTYHGLPDSAKIAGYRRFAAEWRQVDVLADYLLSALDTSGKKGAAAYSDKGLHRKQHDPRHELDIYPFADVVSPAVDEGGYRLTDEEIVEASAYRNGFSTQFFGERAVDELLNCIEDDLERSIARDLSLGNSKRDIQREYRLTESQVRTKIRHIAGCLTPLQ